MNAPSWCQLVSNESNNYDISRRFNNRTIPLFLSTIAHHYYVHNFKTSIATSCSPQSNNHLENTYRFFYVYYKIFTIFYYFVSMCRISG